MKFRRLVGMMGMGLALAAGSAAAQTTWENGLLLQFEGTDSDRPDVENGLGFSVDGLMLFGGRDGVSLNISHSDLDSETAGLDYSRFATTLGYWYYLTNPSRDILRPYYNVGAGYTHHENTKGSGGPDDDGLTVDGALGVVTNGWLLTPGLRARGELRIAYDDVFDGLLDYKVGLGLHYVWGATAQATTYRQQPAPVRQSEPVTPVTPAAPATPPKQTRTIESRANVYFATGSTEINATSRKTLDEAAAKVKAGGRVKAIDVVGHADSTGSAELNKKLSERRAQAVADYLRAQGLTSDQVQIAGSGEESPVGDNNTKEGRAKNRRVEVRLVHVE